MAAPHQHVLPTPTSTYLRAGRQSTVMPLVARSKTHALADERARLSSENLVAKSLKHYGVADIAIAIARTEPRVSLAPLQPEQYVCGARVVARRVLRMDELEWLGPVWDPAPFDSPIDGTVVDQPSWGRVILAVAVAQPQGEDRFHSLAGVRLAPSRKSELLLDSIDGWVLGHAGDSMRDRLQPRPLMPLIGTAAGPRYLDGVGFKSREGRIVIPTMIVFGLVFGRWWRVSLVAAAVAWPVLLVADDVMEVELGLIGAAGLAVINAGAGVLVHQAALRVLRLLRRQHASSQIG